MTREDRRQDQLMRRRTEVARRRGGIGRQGVVVSCVRVSVVWLSEFSYSAAVIARRASGTPDRRGAELCALRVVPDDRARRRRHGVPPARNYMGRNEWPGRSRGAAGSRWGRGWRAGLARGAPALKDVSSRGCCRPPLPGFAARRRARTGNMLASYFDRASVDERVAIGATASGRRHMKTRMVRAPVQHGDFASAGDATRDRPRDQGDGRGFPGR